MTKYIMIPLGGYPEKFLRMPISVAACLSDCSLFERENFSFVPAKEQDDIEFVIVDEYKFTPKKIEQDWKEQAKDANDRASYWSNEHSKMAAKVRELEAEKKGALDLI